MNKHLWTLMIATAALVGGCQNPSPQARNEVPQLLPNHSFSRQWTTELQQSAGNPVTAVHVTDQFIFAYRQDGSSSVMDRQSGTLLHIDHPKEGEQRLHPPVILKDRIVYPSTSFLEVFDFRGRYIPHVTRATDELDKPFSQSMKNPIRSDVVGAGKLVFYGADYPNGGRAVAVDLTRPYVPETWTLMEPGASVPAAPALVKDVVYVASANGKVASVSVETREPNWPLEQGVFLTYGGVVANLMADDSGLYIASTDTKLYCLLRSSGKVKWQYFAGAPLRDAPVLTRDTVYQLVPNVGIVAIDKHATTSNREAIWTVSDAVQFLAQDNKYAYLRTGDNRIVAVDRKTGHQEFQSQGTDLTTFGTNTKDSFIFAASSDDRVMAIKPVLEPGQMGLIVLRPVAREPLAMAR